MAEVSLDFMTGNPQLGVLSGRLNYLDHGRTGTATPSPNSASAAEDEEDEDVKQNGFGATRLDVNNIKLPKCRGALLCILSVPAHMIPTDMLQFAAPFKEHIHSVRVVRPCTPIGPTDPARTPTEYMVLLQMDSQASADDFFLQCNGKRFNSFEDSTCRVVFVAAVTFDLNAPPSTPSVTVVPSAATGSTARFDSKRSCTTAEESPVSTPVHAAVRFSPVVKSTHGDVAASAVAAAAAAAAGGVASSGTPVATLSPNASAWEHNASTCVICMERMDSQVLTTVCNHSFHVECLVKWQDSPCPVCRFHHNNASEASTCQECETTDHLWVCLICGKVLCGSRQQNHIRGHYDSTLHAYAIEIETQQVWDFAGDGFVHRLIHNKADGKLVEISDPEQTSEERPQVPARLSDIQEERLVHGKLEELAYQFNTLLTSQLNEQRHFYQKQLNGLLEQQEKDRRNRRAKVVSGADLIAALRQQKRELESKCASASERLRKTRDETAFLREVNRSLEANREQWSASLKQAQQDLASTRETREKNVPQLEEKVAQLMLKLDAVSAAAAAANRGGGGDGDGKAGGTVATVSAHSDAARPSVFRQPADRKGLERGAEGACPRGKGDSAVRGGGTEETKGSTLVGLPAEGRDAAPASGGSTISGGGKKKGRRRKAK